MASQRSSQTPSTKSGCGCARIPLFLVLLLLGGGYWWLFHLGNANALLTRVGADSLLSRGQAIIAAVRGDDPPQPNLSGAELLANPVMGEPRFMPPPVPNLHAPISEDGLPQASGSAAPRPVLDTPVANSNASPPLAQPNLTNPNLTNPNPALAPALPASTTPAQTVLPSTVSASASPASASADSPQTVAVRSAASQKNQSAEAIKPWRHEKLRGIYLSRYHITNNTSEAKIRQRVRDYKSEGINTIIHGVWGNGCTMYNSRVMQQTLGYESCPNKFKDKWLDWLIDEAHKQNMEVHAYFEKGIKLDKNSPIFELAQSKGWIVPGVDRTYATVDHYVLDVEVPEVATFFKAIATEFVQLYPEIDAMQWDDYLGYHAELPGQIDRTQHLTEFLQSMIADVKRANPEVSFDVCHHNPYWAKRYFAADWENWGVDRAFIQVYNDANFEKELDYVRRHNGVAIADNQMHRLKQVMNDPTIESVFIFPVTLKPEQTVKLFRKMLEKSAP